MSNKLTVDEELYDILANQTMETYTKDTVDQLKTLFSQEIINELETLISRPHRGGLNDTELRIQQRITTLTQNIKEIATYHAS